jgi:hypothetical protein
MERHMDFMLAMQPRPFLYFPASSPFFRELAHNLTLVIDFDISLFQGDLVVKSFIADVHSLLICMYVTKGFPATTHLIMSA